MDNLTVLGTGDCEIFSHILSVNIRLKTIFRFILRTPKILSKDPQGNPSTPVLGFPCTPV